jgi:cytochrome b involved in lipid metabolism
MSTNNDKIITEEELLKNDGKDGKPHWVLIHGNVYDMTNFDHPGGVEVLENEDPTKMDDKGNEFEGIHSTEAKNMMKNMKIGRIVINNNTNNNTQKDNSKSNSDQNSTKNQSGGKITIKKVSITL